VWHLRAKFCPLCGATLGTRVFEGRERPACTGCSFILFRNPACAAAGVVLDDQGRVLLIQRGIEPYRGSWALPAGYQEVDESPAQTACREVFEETGLEVVVTELLDVLYFPDDPRKPATSVVYRCRVTGGTLQAGDDARKAEWFSLDELPEDLAFDNRERILDKLPR